MSSGSEFHSQAKKKKEKKIQLQQFSYLPIVWQVKTDTFLPTKG
jgi:hypothetical protein